MNIPTINIPGPVRFALYLLSALGSLGVTYALTKGYIGKPEVALWSGVVAVINAIAASHTTVAPAAVAAPVVEDPAPEQPTQPSAS